MVEIQTHSLQEASSSAKRRSRVADRGVSWKRNISATRSKHTQRLPPSSVSFLRGGTAIDRHIQRKNQERREPLGGYRRGEAAGAARVETRLSPSYQYSTVHTVRTPGSGCRSGKVWPPSIQYSTTYSLCVEKNVMSELCHIHSEPALPTTHYCTHYPLQYPLTLTVRSDKSSNQSSCFLQGTYCIYYVVMLPTTMKRQAMRRATKIPKPEIIFLMFI